MWNIDIIIRSIPISVSLDTEFLFNDISTSKMFLHFVQSPNKFDLLW